MTAPDPRSSPNSLPESVPQGGAPSDSESKTGFSRRDMLKLAAAASSFSLFGIAYTSTLKGIMGGWWAGEQPENSLSGNALIPEYRVDLSTGVVSPNKDQYLANTTCVGCTSLCGVRVRVDARSGQVLRVSGNPYHPLSASPTIPYETPIKDSFRLTSAYGEEGLHHRATACGRGNAVLDKLYDPYRVLTPLKRSGPRGSGQWQPITFEQLIEEIVEGGNLFGEGHVDGLNDIRDGETPIDPDAPELGPKSNQLAFMAGYGEGRVELAQRFVIHSFGSPNFSGHRGNCGLSMRAGYAALLDDLTSQPHLKPDFANAEFVLNIATSPGNAGNPFKRQARQVAEARSDGVMINVFVDPVLTSADNQAASGRSRWIPIVPCADGALVMGMIRWILENDRYNKEFLSQPNQNAAGEAGEPSWSNATHLVVVSPDSPLFGKFLKGSHLGIEPEGDEDTFVVWYGDDFRPHTGIDKPVELFYSGSVAVDGHSLQVKTSMQILLEASQAYTLEEYSADCGIPVSEIISLAKEFTSYGRRAAADCHGGTMHTTGFYTAYAIVMLNALVGNLNWKGGTSAGGGGYADYKQGPRYNMVDFPGRVKPAGVRISRRGFAYEKTSEYQKKASAGNPYPAQAPWYPFSAAIHSEYIPSALNGYPYPLKALFMWNTNPLYGQSGLYDQARSALSDPRRIPLIVAIDPFINESSAYADYIVPDTVLYETWGTTKPWAGVLTRASSLRWPVVDPPLSKSPDGDPVCMDSFLIALARRMDLPGFGDAAIPDQEEVLHPLNHPEDWHLRVAANVAFDGDQVQDATLEELKLTHLTRLIPALEHSLKPEERLKVAAVLARGGRYEDEGKAYDDLWLTRRYNRAMQIYNETVGSTRSSITGEYFSGVPTWKKPAFVDGTFLEDLYPKDEWPFVAVSTKSQLVSPSTIGTPRLEAIHSDSPVVIHVEDAALLGIANGDSIRIISPAGRVEGIAAVRRGIKRGVIGIEHSFGHWGLGARSETVGGEVWHASKLRAAGVAINRLGLSDPTRQGISTLGDPVVGSNARQGISVRIEKV
jgi:tetrathionate reductase subunit A